MLKRVNVFGATICVFGVLAGCSSSNSPEAGSSGDGPDGSQPDSGQTSSPSGPSGGPDGGPSGPSGRRDAGGAGNADAAPETGASVDAETPTSDGGSKAVDARPPTGDAGSLLTSDEFVSSFGVDSHFNYGGSYDTGHAAMGEWLIGSGIRFVRDTLSTGTFSDGSSQSAFAANLCANGIKYEKGFALHTSVADVESVLNAYTAEQLACLEFVEPQNESDGTGGNWAASVISDEINIYKTVKGNPAWAHIKVLGPSLLNTSSETIGALVTAAKNAGTTLEAISDAANIHTGNCWFNPEKESYASAAATYRVGYPTLPLWVTEFDGDDDSTGDGCYTPDVVEATYETRVWAQNPALGIARSYHYQLGDMTGDAMFGPEGIIDQHGVPKPTGFAVKHLIAILADPGAAFVAVPITLAYSGDTANLEHLLLQRRDGSYQLLLWRSVSVWDYPSFHPSGTTFHPADGISFPAETNVTVKAPWSVGSAQLASTDHECNQTFTRLDFPQRVSSGPWPYAVDPTPVPPLSDGAKCWEYTSSTLTPSQAEVTVPVGATVAVLTFKPAATIPQ